MTQNRITIQNKQDSIVNSTAHSSTDRKIQNMLPYSYFYEQLFLVQEVQNLAWVVSNSCTEMQR